MTVQLHHERLAESHDFGVRLAVRIEIAAALTAADVEAGKGILEDLFEAEELDDPQIHGRVETQAALVRAERAVEFHPETAVDVNRPGIVLPGDPEHDLPLRLTDPLQDLRLGELRAGCQHRGQRLQHLKCRLMELGLPGIPPDQLGVQGSPARPNERRA